MLGMKSQEYLDRICPPDFKMVRRRAILVSPQIDVTCLRGGQLRKKLMEVVLRVFALHVLGHNRFLSRNRGFLASQRGRYTSSCHRYLRGQIQNWQSEQSDWLVKIESKDSMDSVKIQAVDVRESPHPSAQFLGHLVRSV